MNWLDTGISPRRKAARSSSVNTYQRMENVVEQRREGLKALVEAKVQQAMRIGGDHAYQAWERMKEQGRLMEDFIVPLNKGGRIFFHKPDTENAKVMMIANGREGDELFAKAMHKNAWEQLASRLNIPPSWLRDRGNGDDWERGMAAQMLNQYAMHGPSMKVTIRAVGGEVRAVLSDRYKALDTVPVFGSFLASAYARGARMYSGAVTDLNSHIEVLMPEVVEVVTDKRTIHIVFGARISTSDFGRGSLEVRGFYIQGACLNGMVRSNGLRQVHLGKRQSDDGGDVFRDNTRQLQLQTVQAEVADVTEHLLGLPYREDTIRLIQRADGMDIADVQQEVKKLKTYGLSEAEIDEVDSILLAGRYEDGVSGPQSAWNIAQGITAMARDKDDTRKRELEVVAHDWLTEILN